jgi:hypothetical protein
MIAHSSGHGVSASGSCDAPFQSFVPCPIIASDSLSTNTGLGHSNDNKTSSLRVTRLPKRRGGIKLCAIVAIIVSREIVATKVTVYLFV